MKVPLSWLREYVEFGATAEALADRLTFSGVEVEGIDRIGGTYEGVVVGEVMEILPHPNADRLRICKVSNGVEVLTVVCGAPNVAVSDKAPFAQIGAKLANGMTLARTRIRGEWSSGMLCAEDELGISDDHTGILQLSKDTRTGMPLAELLGPPDVVLDLEITWNRGDCLSIIGIAREVAALFGTRVKLPSVDFSEAGQQVDSMASVRVEDPDGCPRYTARVVTGIQQGASPQWMQKRLAMCGVRAISNVVDITNYVMLECGHPLHAFDYSLLKGHGIAVRRAKAGEKIRTLDGIDRQLGPENLVIADSERPVAVAGVMGGEGSEILAGTSDVLLEAATFNAAQIHSTCLKLGMATESSNRYERGVDPVGVDWASRRAVALMVQCAGGKAAKGVIDVFHRVPVPRKIRCTYATLDTLMGVMVPPERVVAILESLQIKVVSRNAESLVAEPPSFRPDLEIEADLIEEVARIHGLEGIPSAIPAAVVVPGMDDARTRAQQACRTVLTGLGFSEIMNYSFLSVASLDRIDPGDQGTRVVLPNPVSADFAIMRNSLVPQMIESLGRNFARQMTDARFFEMGRVFLKDPATGALCEEERVCLACMGRAVREGIKGKSPVTEEEMFLHMKGALGVFCEARGVQSIVLAKCDRPVCESGWAVSVTLDGRHAGFLGLVGWPVRKTWKVVEQIGIAELTLEPFLAKQQSRRGVQAIPAFPSVSRDVAMVVDESLTHDRIVEVIRNGAPKELTAVELFDIFRSEGLGHRRKSMAYTLVYRSLERTLTDEDANGYHESIKARLKKELNAEIREN